MCYYGGVGLIVEYLWFVGVMWGLYFFIDSDKIIDDLILGLI